ncbi:MAG: ribosome silencing factor [Rhodoferax sp.]|nr:ribosome silencing factor [Rhodoferax sp.]
MTTSTAAKKDISKLQRAIVDGLENTKAQDIRVFDTEHLSPLFERVIMASGTSNRQTRALSVSVCDAVRKAGFPKPRVEGQTNGEWIIVDCGRAVTHIMQPNHRQYYKLEELWGEKPVRIKLGAEKPKPAAQGGQNSSTPASTVPTKAQPPGLRRSSAAKKGVEEAFPSKAAAKKARAAAAGGSAPAPARKRAAPSKTKAAGQDQQTPAPAKKGIVASLVSKVVALASARKPASKP